MRYSDFEEVVTNARMHRYLIACGNNTKKAMTLYRLNLKLSQELFTVISCFEVALRNSIDNKCSVSFGTNWLRASASSGGIFDTNKCRYTATSINDAVNKLNHLYTHNKLVAELGFGFWRYMFAPNQYNATGRTLLAIFPAKPTSTIAIQYNQTFVFNQLAQINNLRNRIAHHEPVCFQSGHPVKDTGFIRLHYSQIKSLFQWMDIDDSAFLYGLDHIDDVSNRIDAL